MPFCDFCEPSGEMQRRTVREGDHSYSMVSNPSFRVGQTLVIPKRHFFEITEAEPEEILEIARELGRLAGLLNAGCGYEILQKHQPTKPDDAIKRSHFHFHVIPRLPDDGILSVPEPNTSEGFRCLDDAALQMMVEKLR